MTLTINDGPGARPERRAGRQSIRVTAIFGDGGTPRGRALDTTLSLTQAADLIDKLVFDSYLPAQWLIVASCGLRSRPGFRQASPCRRHALPLVLTHRRSPNGEPYFYC